MNEAVVLRFRLAFAGLLVVVLGLVACGGEPAFDCASVECGLGVCDASTGKCKNPAQCDAERPCLAGYDCDAGQCVARVACDAQTPCERGECRAGACVSPPQCSGDEACVPGEYCGSGGECVVDRCAANPCERGVCQRETGLCVNDGLCAFEHEDRDCLEGYYCYDQGCVSESELCEAMGCGGGRGVCDAEARECLNAASCEGRDANCLPGYYCDDDDRCAANVCDETGTTCARGVCDGATATCVNPERCEAATDCLDAHLCIEGRCEPGVDACAVCPGNQVCEYDAQGLTVRCDENPHGCVNALDCTGNRACRAGTCGVFNVCVSDSFEPNDSPDEAVDLNDLRGARPEVVEATVCASDIDHYSFDTRGQGLIRGVLVFNARHVREDVGVGALRLRVLDDDGAERANVVSDANGDATVTLALLAHEMGVYTAEVSAAGELGPSGVRYTLFGDFLATSVVDACEDAAVLEPGITSGNTRTGTSAALGSSCAGGAPRSTENLYRLDLTRRTYVDLQVTPGAGSGVDLAMGLRHNCLSVASEAVCHDEGGEGDAERIRTTLDPGTYYLVVHGASATSGGAYTLEYRAEPVVCVPGHGQCMAASRSQVCNATGTGFESVECTMGCNDALGFCNREPGDVCYVAIDATGGYSGAINWLMYANDYDPSPSCVPANGLSEATGGADVSYRVDLPAGHAVQAVLTSAVSYTSLYVVTDCSALAHSCLASANSQEATPQGDFVETLVYRNNTAQTQRVYIVADSGPTLITGDSQIAIESGPMVCTPGEQRCNGEALEVCGPAGTSFSLERPCPFGCNAAELSCEPDRNDTCKGAVDILARGGRFTNVIDGYVNAYNPGGDGCTGSPAPGRDAVFFVDAEAGDIVTARIEAAFDASLWVTTDCTRAAETCVAGADRFTTGEETLVFVAPETRRYYLVADGRAGNNLGLFTLEVEVQEPTCMPGAVVGCKDATTLELCGDLGLPFDYTCSTACSSDRCEVSSGGACADALPLSAGQTVTGNFAGVGTIDPGEGQAAACDFGTSAPIGVETVYAIDLAAGERLTIDVQSQTFFTVVYLLGGCAANESCLANTPEGQRHRLVYDAPRDETIYVVVDRTLPSPSTNTYSLTATVQAPGCVADSVQCIDAATLGVCGHNGFFEPYVCDGGCTTAPGDVARCAAPRGDICQDAVVLADGASVTGNWAGTNTVNPGAGLVGACEFGSADAVGPETVYAVDLVAGDVLHARLTTTSSSALLYLMDDCLVAESCRMRAPSSGSGELYFVAEEAGRHYLVVDRTVDTVLTTGYTLDVRIEQPSCTPGQQRCANEVPDGSELDDVLEVCNVWGLFEPYECTNGCAPSPTEGDRCHDPDGDVCLEAIPLLSGDSVTGRFNGTNAVNPGAGTVGVCAFGSSAGVGADTIYSVELIAGERLHAFVDSGNSQTLLYLLDDCDQGESCLANSAVGSRPELVYTADVDRTVYLVVDRTSSISSSTTFELRVEIHPPGCDPGQTLCLGDDTLGLCAGGDGYFTPYFCDGVCTIDRCETPRGDICEDVRELHDGDRVSGDWRGSNAFEPGPGRQGQCDFGTIVPRGGDTVYAIDLQAGDVLEAAVTTTSSSAHLYVLEDCGQAAASCAANQIGANPRVRYQADSDRTVYVVVDTQLTTTSLTYDLAVDIHTPECTPGARRCADGATLEVCDGFGLWEAFACTNGCAADACLAPSGDHCYEAMPLVSGDRVSGTWMGSRSVNPGRGEVGSCDFGPREAAGPDTIYSVWLNAGQVLRAELLTTSTSAMLYVMEDCSRASSCLAALPTVGATPLYYEAEVTGLVYVVVDLQSTFISATRYELDVTVQTPGCAAGSQRCRDDGVTLEYCNDDGLWDAYVCDGTCTDGRCDTPSGDSCLDVLPVEPGTVVHGNWTGTNAVVGGPGVVGPCNFDARPGLGRDTIYAVDVQAGQVLQARLETTNSSAFLYLLDDCGDTDSCRAVSSHGAAPTLHYEAVTSERLYLVVDSTSSFSTQIAYALHVDMLTPDCVAGSVLCDVDGQTLVMCNAYGLESTYVCDGLCSGTRCESPRGDVCVDAVPLASGEQFSGHFADFTDTSDPGTSTCMLGRSTQPHSGRDAVFAIELNAGDLLEATLNTTVATAGMYVLDSCLGTAAETCLHAEPTSRSLRFLAEETKTYYLVVDSSTPWATAEFTVAVEVSNDRAICQPASTSCSTTTGVLSRCNEDGTIHEAIATCPSGCAGAQCAGPLVANSSCAEVFDITSSTRIRDTLGRFEDRVNPGAASCIGADTPGRDAVYRVNLQAGEVVRARLWSDGSMNDAVLTAVTNCYAAAETCVDTARAGTNGATVGYRAEGPESVYLIVDALSTVSRGTFVLDVELYAAECEPGPPVCTDAGTLRSCSDYGEIVEMSCAHGCADGQCVVVSNDTCADALDATGGLSFSGHLGDYTDRYTPGLLGCTGNHAFGPDAVFFVDLEAFDKLTITYTPAGYDASLWVARDCANAAGTCVAGSDSAGYGVTEQIEYVAPEAGRYYIFADAYGSFARGPFELDIQVAPPFCQPQETTCAGSTLLVCSPDRSRYDAIACLGGCIDGACGVPRGDICQDPIDATSGGTFTGNFSELTNDLSPRFGDCTGFEADGPDAIYAVELRAGQTLTAMLSNVTAAADLSLYVVANCYDAANSCLVGSDTYGTGAEQVHYVAPTDQTVYVVADSYTLDPVGTFEVTIVVN